MSVTKRLPVEATESDIPEGWARARLPDLADINMGQSPPGSTYNELMRGMPFFQGKIDFGERYPTVRVWCTQPIKIAKPGDVLISVRAPVGPTNVADHECAIGRGLAGLRPLAGTPTEFLLFALRLQQPDLSLRGTGSTFTAISKDDIEGIEIDVPPLAEQKRIVEKLEQLLARVNSTRDRLVHVPAILKRLRQAVLAAACSGHLTADWREQHPEAEPGSKLLLSVEKFRIDRAGKDWQAKRVRGMSAEPVDGQDETVIPELPESWTWCRVDQIATVCLGGTPSRKKHSYWNGDVAWVSSGEVANCRISKTREKITREGLSNSNAKVYPRGTVLIAMIGEGKTRGQAAILDIEACTNQNVAGLVFDAGSIVSDFVWFWALSEYERNRAVGRGGAQPALNGEKVRALVLPLPSFEEQREIVRHIEALFKLADAIEKRVAAATVRTEKLTQAILAKAFRGELVPTEAELARREGRAYEPASVLLTRIHDAREQVRETPRRRRIKNAR